MMAISLPKTIALAAGLALAACSTQSASEAQPPPVASELAVHPVSGLEIVPVTVFTEDGRHDFRAEVADDPATRSQGLMFRSEMADDEAMIFLFDEVEEQGFWMRNTVIPLDIIFIGPGGRIVNIAENAVPYSEESRRSEGLVAAVLEINGGLSAELGIGPGDRVEW